MFKFKKKSVEQKVKEPAYFISATNIQTTNYKVYYMTSKEKVFYFVLAFVVGAVVGYLFYGGIGTDEFGQPTAITYILNVLISSIVGFVAGYMFIPMRRQQIIDKRQRELKHQFRDMLEALSTSLGAGKNVNDSFLAVYEDLKVQYEEDSDILKELEVIIAGMNNNIDIEDTLMDFGIRSGIEDIESFANVFKICYRKGGNIKDTIRNTHEILSDKMEITEDIETIVTSSKNEQNIMIIMPLILVGMMKMMGEDFAKNFVTPTGLVSTTIAIVLFVVAYIVGKKVLEIKI